MQQIVYPSTPARPGEKGGGGAQQYVCSAAECKREHHHFCLWPPEQGARHVALGTAKRACATITPATRHASGCKSALTSAAGTIEAAFFFFLFPNSPPKKDFSGGADAVDPPPELGDDARLDGRLTTDMCACPNATRDASHSEPGI